MHECSSLSVVKELVPGRLICVVPVLDSFLFFNLLENLKGVCAEVLSPGYVRCKLVVYVVVGVRLVDESFGQSAESELVILNNVSAQVARINSLQLEN